MNAYRRDFPYLSEKPPVVYLDNAATSQVPYPVLDAVEHRVKAINANVHRGIHRMSEESTADYERSREAAARYLNTDRDEIVFTSGATHSINLVASSAAQDIKPGQKIVATVMEHHSNFLPWQQLCGRTGAEFRVVGLDPNGDLDMTALEEALTENTAILAVTGCSNVTGAVSDLGRLCRLAHAKGVPILVDGAQDIAHCHPDLRQIDCDYYCFSAHKIQGLTGTGVLYAKRERMEALHPLCYGGGTVKDVDLAGARFEKAPSRLEAGTPNFVGAAALRAALDYRQAREAGPEGIFAREAALLARTERGLREFERVRVLGSPKTRRGCISFAVEGAHPYDVAALLDQKGIAVRSGHHCAAPLLRALGLDYAVRVSPAFYNDEDEIDRFLEAMEIVLKII